MPQLLSQLNNDDQARLFEELNYMNMEDIRGFCSQVWFPQPVLSSVAGVGVAGVGVAADGCCERTTDFPRFRLP